jgi:hypothetical protein
MPAETCNATAEPAVVENPWSRVPQLLHAPHRQMQLRCSCELTWVRTALSRHPYACVQSVAGSSPRSSSSEKDAEEGGMLGRLSPAQRHQLAVLLDTAMLKVRGAATAPLMLHLEAAGLQ